MIKVGIVGVGTIGFELAKACIGRLRDDVRLVGVVDTNHDRETAVRKRLGLSRRYTLSGLIKSTDLVIEAASAAAAYPIARQAMSQGKDVMLMSAGGIVKKAAEIYRIAKQHRSCLYLPSGAVAGIDALKSAHIGRVRSVSLVTRKAPRGFEGAPYVVRRRINLSKIRAETLLFEGSAERAIEGFPQNINVSATLSLAGIGAAKTRVKIYACPGLEFLVHEVTAKGDFGEFTTRTQNRPSTQNPKTSRLAVLSAIATLTRILNVVKIGT